MDLRGTRGAKGLRLAVAVVLGMGAALPLAACQSAAPRDEMDVPAVNATAAEDFQAFQHLMGSQPTNVTIDYHEECTAQDAGEGQGEVIDFQEMMDVSGDEDHRYFTYSEDGIDYQVYREGDRVVDAYEDAVVEGSYEEGTWHGATAASVAHTVDWRLFDFAVEENLKSRTTEGDTEVFTFGSDDISVLDATALVVATHAEAIYTFQGNRLTELRIEASGNAPSDAGGTFEARTTVTMTFSNWGGTDIPAAPEPSHAMQNSELDEVRPLVLAAIDGIGDNFTCQTQTTTVVGEGESAQKTGTYGEFYLDDGRTMVYLEAEGSPLDKVTVVMDGDKSRAVKDEQEVSVDTSLVQGSSDGSDQARQLVDLASEVSVYENTDGVTQYALTLDTQAFAALPQAASFGIVSQATAYYDIKPDGNLQGFMLHVRGTAAEGGAPLRMELASWYSEQGTTEVPEL